MARVSFRLALGAFAAVFLSASAAAADERKPVFVGLDAEFGLLGSASAQSIERGIRIAIDEINRKGGVLKGRPLELLIKDNRSVPARGVKNLIEFAEIDDLVAVVGGRFSPVLIEQVPLTAQLPMILLAPWSSADPVVDNGTSPNYVFRLSLYDSLAMPAMLDYARSRGIRRVGLLLFNTAWGRSNLVAAERFFATAPELTSVGTVWFNWNDASLMEKYQRLAAAGAEAIVLVANDDRGALLVKEIASLPRTLRLPVISHWGITGGDFVGRLGDASILDRAEVAVIQTFSFFSADPSVLQPFMETAKRLEGLSRIEDFDAPVGTAHAYDLIHILARAIDVAGTTDRAKVRDALEQVRNYRGLVRYYERPFTPDRHEALDAGDVSIARYRGDGVIVPYSRGPTRPPSEAHRRR